MLKLFDTAKGQVVPLEVRDPGKVSMYVCGPTVYGPAHLGHGRFSLVFDILRRYLEWSGLEVTYVSNITDVDDKIIDKANQEGTEPALVARKNEKSWWKDMDALGVKRPTQDPHATAYIERMVELIADLVDRGAAYETDDGVYFRTEVVDDYGLLARQSLDSLRSGARVEVVDAKQSPLDFAVWKKAKPGEPSWPSPWGDGRPGWHTECVVMSLDLLGDGFDLHGGGLDLAFPHHENERAQAVAAGRPFATHWMHNGFLEVGGEKMSKSLGNFTTLGQLVRSSDPRAYRLLVLRSHYRSPMEVSKVSTDDASAALRRLDTFARRVSGLPRAEPEATVVAEFQRLMDDDLNTPAVVDLLFTQVRQGNLALDVDDDDSAAVAAANVAAITEAVGLTLQMSVGEVTADALDLATARDRARAERDWARADQLRDELTNQGYEVEDTPQGTTIRRR